MNNLRCLQNLVSFCVGFLFAIGLAVSGMTQPQKVLSFLDPWGWDPSLLFVMVGAVAVHMLSYRLIKRRRTPLLDQEWHIPKRHDITKRLLLGSAIFGIGWGIAGFCPGPALTSLVTGDLRVWAFVAAMIVGMLVFKSTECFFKF